MAYITKQDLEDAYGQFDIDRLADRDNDQDPDKMRDAVAKAIEGATSEVDGYLAVKYDLPLGAAPRLVKNLATNIAVYLLSGAHVTEQMEALYKNATKLLEKISKGEIDLNIKKIPAVSVKPQVLQPARIFSRDKMGGF